MTQITKYDGTAKVDSAGRILIPLVVRESLGLVPGNTARIELNNGLLVVHGNAAKECQGCGSDLSADEIAKYPIVKEAGMCRSCILTTLTS